MSWRIERPANPIDATAGWMGNIPRATTIGGGTKVSRPTTKKQIKSADWLRRGYSSAEDAAKEKSSSAKEKSRILHDHHNFIYEEENPSLRLINCVQQSQELSREVRKQA
jgi:hypothetical protein